MYTYTVHTVRVYAFRQRRVYTGARVGPEGINPLPNQLPIPLLVIIIIINFGSGR